MSTNYQQYLLKKSRGKFKRPVVNSGSEVSCPRPSPTDGCRQAITTLVFI